MPRTLFAASSNPGKLRDFAVAAEAYGISILPLAGLDTIPAPEENGATFEDNARLKAVYYSQFSPGELVIADDSGLEVDALGGEPGVRSARYAADAGFGDVPNVPVDERNNLYLLHQLQAHASVSPSARYRCVIALARDGEVLLSADGSVEGEILPAPRGNGGFGYDPLFLIPFLGKTMAEIDLTTKLGLSHRGRAFAKLLDAISKRSLL